MKHNRTPLYEAEADPYVTLGQIVWLGRQLHVHEDRMSHLRRYRDPHKPLGEHRWLAWQLRSRPHERPRVPQDTTALIFADDSTGAKSGSRSRGETAYLSPEPHDIRYGGVVRPEPVEHLPPFLQAVGRRLTTAR